MHMMKKSTHDWEKELKRLRQTLEEELEKLQDKTKPIDLDQPIGRLTRIDALQDQQITLAQKRRIQNRLSAIKGALQRLTQGSFGLCVDCEEEIEEKRLYARPETFLCLNCQRERE